MYTIQEQFTFVRKIPPGLCWIALLGLICSLHAAPQIWKWDKLRFSEQQTIGENSGSHAELNDSFSSIIQSGFNRDSLLQDFSFGRQLYSFGKLKQVELVTTNTSNGIHLLVDDPANFIRYLRSPESVSDLIPALVCDIVFFCVSYGSVGKYSTLMKWREAYVRQHPDACLLVFHNDEVGVQTSSRLAFKLLNHLYLIKAISDGRIITRTKYDELLQSGLMSTPTSDLGRPRLQREDENSIKEFIRLLTPHISSGIGIPSNADMSQYPSMFFVDLDTLFTNKSITVPNFLQRVDEGLKLQPILPSVKNEKLSNDLNPHPYSSADADFLVSADIACHWGFGTTINTGVHLSRPTKNVADLLMAAAHNRYGDGSRREDQGALTLELELMSGFNYSQVIAECLGEEPRWLRPEYQNRIVFASVLSENSTDKDDQALAQTSEELNQKRCEHMESIWGPPVGPLKGSRVPLVAVVNLRWCNSMFLNDVRKAPWRPGDWIAHFTIFKKEKMLGKGVREWVCNNLDFVAHPEGWPSTPYDCFQLIENGFRASAVNEASQRSALRNSRTRR